jgi:hypothetical protein
MIFVHAFLFKKYKSTSLDTGYLVKRQPDVCRNDNIRKVHCILPYSVSLFSILNLSSSSLLDKKK